MCRRNQTKRHCMLNLSPLVFALTLSNFITHKPPTVKMFSNLPLLSTFNWAYARRVTRFHCCCCLCSCIPFAFPAMSLHGELKTDFKREKSCKMKTTQEHVGWERFCFCMHEGFIFIANEFVLPVTGVSCEVFTVFGGRSFTNVFHTFVRTS